MRAIAMMLGLLLLLATGTPAHAIEPYPGETQEAFAARAQLDQASKLAAADAAGGQSGGGGFASGGSKGLGGALGLGTVSLAMLVLGGLRMSRGLFRASRTIARAGGAGRSTDSFEDRLAEKLRELERATPTVAPPPPETPVMPPPPRAATPGPRTFGRRAS